MKPALYYAIRRNLYHTVAAITSEKKGRYIDKWYGRDCEYGESTNGTVDQLRGRFKTCEEAEAMRLKISIIADDYDRQRDVHHKAISKLYQDESNAIEAAIATGSNA